MCCDKLAVLSVVMAGPEVLGRFPGLACGPDRPGRNRGRWSSMVRWGTAAGWDGEPIFVKHTGYEGLQTSEVRVECNPAKQGPEGLRVVGRFLRDVGADVLGARVERVDVACDFRGVDRSRFRLDTGRYRLTQYGAPDQAGYTEAFGYGGRWDVQVVLYDKRAERVAAGDADPGEWMRFEVRRRGRTLSLLDGSVGDVRLRDLASMAWPGPAECAVREFVYLPEHFADGRYALLSAGAYCYGTRFAERAAREVLGRKLQYRDQLRSVAWPEVDPCPRAAFEREWGRVAREVVVGLGG